MVKGFLSPNRTRPKKRSSPNIEGFLSPKLGEDQKKNLHRSLVLYLAGIWHLFVLTGTFFSNHPALKSRWEDANSQ